MDEILYNNMQVAEKLNISIYTLKKWYMWQTHMLRDGRVDKPYLPEPIKATNAKGKPNMWTEEMISQLEEYKHNMVVGNQGIYGKYTNPNHTQTKKYLKEQEEQNGTNNVSR